VSSYQKRAGDLDTAAKTGMTQEGQANVIKSKANRPGYSQGQNRLDTALMGGTIGKGFSAITEALKPVTSSIDQWNTALANKVKAEGDQASANAKAVANAVNAKVASETKRLEDVAAAKNTYSPVPSTGGKVDASKYVQQSPMLASASNVAGVDDVAYMKALQELSGNQLPAYLDAGQAGTYQLPTFDTAGYNAAVQQQVSDQNKADYNAYIASLPKTNKQGSMITVAPTFEQWVTSPSKEVKQPDGTTKTVKTIKPTYRRGAK
jgi:hypothetical protein